MLNAVKHPAKSLAKYQREILHFVQDDTPEARSTFNVHHSTFTACFN